MASRAHFVAALASLVLLASAGSIAAQSPGCTTIAQFLAGNQDQFSILTAALNVTTLLGEISKPGSTVTLFAPNDAAWLAYMAGSNYSTVEDLLDEPFLEEILANHVLERAWKAVNFPSPSVYGTSADENLTVAINQIGQSANTTAIEIFSSAGQASVLVSDIATCQSVVHIVNGVLTPFVGLSTQEQLAQLLSLIGHLGADGLVKGPEVFANVTVEAVNSGLAADVAQLIAVAWQSGYPAELAAGAKQVLITPGGPAALAKTLLYTLSQGGASNYASTASWALSYGVPELFTNVTASAITTSGCTPAISNYLAGVKAVTGDKYQPAVAAFPTLRNCTA